MTTYLITPAFVLGSDSFTLEASNDRIAVEDAKKRIKREDWHSPNGWEIYEFLGHFEDANVQD